MDESKIKNQKFFPLSPILLRLCVLCGKILKSPTSALHSARLSFELGNYQNQV